MNTDRQAGVAVHREYDRTQTPPSVAVVSALADIKNITASSLTTERRVEIHGGIDPDSLDRLLDREGVEVTFDVGRYRVRIDGEELTISLQ